MSDSLGELLVKEGALSPQALERALERQREAGGTLDTALLELGLLGEDEILRLLSVAAGVPPAPGGLSEIADPRARRVFPSKVAERHALAPFALDGSELSLAAAWPVNLALLDEISFMLSLHLQPHIGLEWQVRELIQKLYGTPLSQRLARLAERSRAGGRKPAAAAGEAGPEEAAAAEGQAREPQPLPQAQGFGRGPSEPAEPLLAALAQAVEEAEVDQLLEEPMHAVAAEEIDRTAPPHWSLEQAAQALVAARTRDEVVVTALRYARDFFDYAALLAVTREAITGHDAMSASDEGARQRCRQLSLQAGELGIFRTVIETCGPYLGPAHHDPTCDAVLAGLGRESPRTMLLYPVILRDRTVCLLFADNGEAPVSPRRLGDLLMLAGSVGRAFERTLRERKGRAGAGREDWTISEPGRIEAPLPADTEVDLKDFEVSVASEALAVPQALDPGEAAERLARSVRGSSERGNLIARLVEQGMVAAPFLCARFPGPLEVTSPSLAELTPVDEQGPILAAVVAVGAPAVPHLLPLLADGDAQRRRYAVLALARIGEPSVWPAVAERVYDADPLVAAAARGALTAARRQAELSPILEALRRALVTSPAWAVQTAQTLGQLKDVESIPLLIQLLDSGGVETAAAAADALAQITLRRLGESAQSWLAWWNEKRSVPRWRWLLDALEDPDRDLRIAAAEELRLASPPPVPYLADAPAAERARAAKAWEEACQARPPET